MFMANHDDYGYFGKGASGYAHYTQTFNQCFGDQKSTSSAPRRDSAPPRSTASSDEQVDAFLLYAKVLLEGASVLIAPLCLLINLLWLTPGAEINGGVILIEVVFLPIFIHVIWKWHRRKKQK
jgi:ABC-type transport system involved in cytochrome bd biosynthesis fused ATPase/permease subunit